MHKYLLLILLACSFVVQPAFPSEEDTAESEANCESETDEPCVNDEDELERGFDPCLINAKLPACQSEDEATGTAPAERAQSDSDESEDG